MSPRVDRLLRRLTTREKVGQLNQRLLGWNALRRIPTSDGARFEVTEEAHEEIERWGGLGSMYGLFRADAWSGRSWSGGIRPEERAEAAATLQAAVTAGSAHGIGTLIAEEAPHGHQALGGTLLPVNLTSAAAWDPAALADASRAVAAELAASGVHLALVSALDVLRDPRWGRAEECFGEDPYLASQLTSAIVYGMQGEGRSLVGVPGAGNTAGTTPSSADAGVAVVLKHLAAQGEAIGGRNGQSAQIGVHDLAEIHMPPVRAGLDAGALGFMSAYNDIDGIPCCANPELLQTYLRERNGFDGIVMADMGAIDRLAEMTGDPGSAGRAALLAGVDLSLCDHSYTLLEELADADRRVANALDDSCRRVLALKDRFGLLTPAPEGRETGGERERVDVLARARTGAQAASRHLAEQSLVLLSNPSEALPLEPSALRRVAVIGPFADDVPALLGDYVPPLPADSEPSIAGAVRAALPQAEVGVGATPGEVDLRRADAVILAVGGTSHRSYDDEFADNGAIAGNAGRATGGEGVDRADVSLPFDQDALIERVRAEAPPTAPVIGVVVTGRPHVLTRLLDVADAVLLAGYPGPYGGRAIADALLGRTEPTGRLPFTLPRHPSAIPVRYNDRQSADGVYQDAPEPVLLPFGHGLRYTDVLVTDLEAKYGEAKSGVASIGERWSLRPASGEASADGALTLGIGVENRSGRATRVVLPVFAHRRGGDTVPRRREVIAHVNTELGARGRTRLSIILPASTVFAAPLVAGCVTRIEVAGRTLELHADEVLAG